MGLKQRYQDEIAPQLQKEFKYVNVMQIPRMKKITLNVGLGEALTNAKAVDSAIRDLSTISGQKPVVSKARKSIATFKVREGQPLGVKVTLRGERRWEFL